MWKLIGECQRESSRNPTMLFAPRILALPSSPNVIYISPLILKIGLILIYQYGRVTMPVAILGRLLALEEKFSPNP
jgi:hypothetical protein